MEEERLMSDQPPIIPDVKDFPDHWGFYLLQAVNRLQDEQRRTADVLRQEMHGLRQEIHALDTLTWPPE